MSSTPYEALGVACNASTAEIRRAYKHAAARAHPDRQGGSLARMTEINAARDLLCNAARRAHFDATGETQDEGGRHAKALEMLQNITCELLHAHSDEIADREFLFYLRDEVSKGLAQMEKDLFACKRGQARVEKLLDRTRSAELKLALEGSRERFARKRAELEAMLRVGMEMARICTEGM